MKLLDSVKLKKIYIVISVGMFLSYSLSADTNNNLKRQRRLRDPFSKGTVYVSSAPNMANDKFFVAGIVIMENGEKYAVLHIPGYENNFLVTENQTLSLMNGASGTNSSYQKNINLKIIKINESEIVVAPDGDIQRQFIIR